MPRRISTVLGVEASRLRALGVFNGFVDIDSKLYVDPYLLRTARTPELQGAHDDYCAYFEAVLKLIRASKADDDALFRAAVARLHFPEHPVVALGYADGSTSGTGIGPELALHLATTAKEIIEAGISDPTIFDLVGLIESNVGADRISDMTIAIILPRLLAFSVRVAAELGVPTASITHDRVEYRLPLDAKTDRPVLLLPAELLRTLPLAKDWSCIEIVCAHNAGLRRTVNEIIGDTWKHATNRVTKKELRRALLSHPELLKDLLSQYKAKEGRAYDFNADPEGLLVWHEAAQAFCAEHPLALAQATPSTLPSVVDQICARFGQLIENNGLNRLFYSDTGHLRNERYAQLLFYGIADAYCAANDLNLSREPNAGRGAVDFKLSTGYSGCATVELKYSSNPDLVHGYETQLPTYNAAESAGHSVYLVLQTKDSTKNIEKLIEARNQALARGLKAPEIHVFDARRKPSASKA